MRLVILTLMAAVGLAAAEHPRRIISTAPSITEMLYALGLGDRVAGVTTYCHYPPEARGKPKIGTYLRPDLEAILHLRPDLVVLLEGGSLKEKLPAFGIPAMELKHDTIDGICRSLLDLGRRTGAEAAAEQKVAALRGELRQIQERVAGRPRRRVMFLVGRTPRTILDLIAAGRASFLNELIELAGGENIFRDSAVPYPRVSREEIFSRRPEVIIDMGDMADTDQVTAEHTRSVVELWKQLPLLPAVQNGRVYAVASDVFVVPGPRVVEAGRALARMIHPEAGL